MRPPPQKSPGLLCCASAALSSLLTDACKKDRSQPSQVSPCFIVSSGMVTRSVCLLRLLIRHTTDSPVPFPGLRHESSKVIPQARNGFCDISQVGKKWPRTA